MKNHKSFAPLFLKLLSLSFSSTEATFKQNNIKPIFILSTGRTGTTFLANFLNSQSSVTAFHEPKPSRILRMWSFAYMNGKVSKDWMASILYKKRKKIINSVDNHIYIESNPYLIGFVDVLNEVFNKPIIIHVLRDPRDFVRSSLNHGNDSGIKLFFNNYVPYWYPDIKSYLKINRKLTMDEKAIGFWSLANNKLIEANQNNPNYHQIKFEDLFNNNNSYKQIADIVGLESINVTGKFKKPINASRKSTNTFWESWSTSKIRFIDTVCGSLMKRFSYGTEKKWLSKLKVE